MPATLARAAAGPASEGAMSVPVEHRRHGSARPPVANASRCALPEALGPRLRGVEVAAPLLEARLDLAALVPFVPRRDDNPRRIARQSRTPRLVIRCAAPPVHERARYADPPVVEPGGDRGDERTLRGAAQRRQARVNRGEVPALSQELDRRVDVEGAEGRQPARP